MTVEVRIPRVIARSEATWQSFERVTLMWYLKIDTLLLMLAAAVVFAFGSWLLNRKWPEKRLTPWLLVLDLGIMAYVDWQLAVFYALYTVFSWALVRLMGKIRRGRKLWFVALCLLDLVPFFYARLAGFFPQLPAIFVLVGFSYNMLKAVDAIFYTYYTEEPVPFLTYANFLLFFPVITGGPIYRYRDFLKYYRKPQMPTAQVTEESIKRFPDGRILVIYAQEEIGGFAIHLQAGHGVVVGMALMLKGQQG